MSEKLFVKYKTVMAGSVTIGDKVFSPLLGECFTVKRTQRSGIYVIFRDGTYSMRYHINDNVRVLVE